MRWPRCRARWPRPIRSRPVPLDVAEAAHVNRADRQLMYYYKLLLRILVRIELHSTRTDAGLGRTRLSHLPAWCLIDSGCIRIQVLVLAQDPRPWVPEIHPVGEGTCLRAP